MDHLWLLATFYLPPNLIPIDQCLTERFPLQWCQRNIQGEPQTGKVRVCTEVPRHFYPCSAGWNHCLEGISEFLYCRDIYFFERYYHKKKKKKQTNYLVKYANLLVPYSFFGDRYLEVEYFFQYSNYLFGILIITPPRRGISLNCNIAGSCCITVLTCWCEQETCDYCLGIFQSAIHLGHVKPWITFQCYITRSI